MKEIQIISGKHHCGKMLDLRIIDEKDEKEGIFTWIIYGICDPCKEIILEAIFKQEEEPLDGLDFIINYNKRAKGLGREELDDTN